MSTTVLITAIIASIYYLSGSDIKQLFVLTLIGFLVSIILIIGSPYRQARLQTLIDPSSDISGKSYHSNQIIISIASGGLFGKGIGNSSQKYQFLPELTTDSILAIIGEETGFLGISFIIFLYVLLIISIFKISKASPDPENQLISAGVGCWIAFQSLINISAIASIIPLTGIPLPFISYGGSSLLMLLSSIGIILNINNQNQLSSKIQKK
jgi:cell division protein FtsW